MTWIPGPPRGFPVTPLIRFFKGGFHRVRFHRGVPTRSPAGSEPGSARGTPPFPPPQAGEQAGAWPRSVEAAGPGPVAVGLADAQRCLGWSAVPLRREGPRAHGVARREQRNETSAPVLDARCIWAFSSLYLGIGTYTWASISRNQPRIT